MKKILKSFIMAASLAITPLVAFSMSKAAQAADAIVTNSLNFRAGPGTNYAIRGQIPSGQLINVQSCSGNWCQISYGNRTGFASIKYIAFRDSRSVYNRYNRPSSSFNIIIGGGRNHFYHRPYGPRPPMFYGPGIHHPSYNRPGFHGPHREPSHNGWHR